MRRCFFCWLALSISAWAEIKLVTYNIRQDTGSDRGARDWSKRSPGVVSFLNEGGFSIIGLQEARHNQVVDVENGLAGFKRIGVGRSDGKMGGEYSPLLYDSKVWKADEEDQGTFWLSDTPEKPGSMTWGNGVTRICSWARLIDKEGKGLYIFNTHWDHQSQASREKSAKLILERIKGRKKPKDEVILMGDFNASMKNPAIVTLMESGLLFEPQTAEGKLTFNFWKPELKEGARIDHVFTTASLKEGTLTVLQDGDPVNSDHHPVVLLLPKTAQ